MEEDRVLLPFDLLGSLAHARMLTRQGLLPLSAGRALVRELVRLRREAEKGTFSLDAALEDVHMNVESALTSRLGDVGARLPTGRSRNDQVATDLALYLRDALMELEERCLGSSRALLAQAGGPQGRYVVPAMTHLQDAQRVYLAQILQVHARRLARDAARLRQVRASMVFCPLGSGALAGSSLPLDRAYTARALGFREPHPNAMDAVSDRDSAAETLAAIALLGVHLSSLAEEWVLWSTPQFARLRLDDAFVTTSSLMPHKRNPDLAELLRAESGPLTGLGVAHLVTLKGLPLAYNRDLQTLKPLLFEGVRRALRALRVLEPMVRTARFHPSTGSEARSSPTASVELADELVRAGVPFREAHRRVARFLLEREQDPRAWSELSRAEWSSAFPELRERSWAPPASHQEPERRRTSGGSSWAEVSRDRRLLTRALERSRTSLQQERARVRTLEERLETGPIEGPASRTHSRSSGH